MTRTEQFYENDTALLEIQTGVFAPVKVLGSKLKFGRWYYEVAPIGGVGQMRVEKLKKIK